MENISNGGFNLDKALADAIDAKMKLETQPAEEVVEEVEAEAEVDNVVEEGAPEVVETAEAEPEAEKGDKQHHAFAKLRKEKKELEKVASEQGQKLEQLVSLFDAGSVDELLEHLESEGIRIKSSGVGKDVETLKKEMDAAKELERIKAEKEALELKLEDQRIVKVIDDFASKYGLTAASDFNKMIDTLESAGLDFETLRKAKNPELLIKGATTDLVLEKVKTKKVSAIEKSRSTRESAFEEQAAVEVTKEQELRNSLKDYFKIK